MSNANSLVLRMQSTDTFNLKQVVKTWKQKPQIFIVNVKIYAENAINNYVLKVHSIQVCQSFIFSFWFKYKHEEKFIQASAISLWHYINCAKKFRSKKEKSNQKIHCSIKLKSHSKINNAIIQVLVRNCSKVRSFSSFMQVPRFIRLQLLKHNDLNAAQSLDVIILAMHAAYVIPVAADGNFPLLSFSFV